jgi:hypothetical protein
MGIFYSPSAPGFFDDAIHAAIPQDAVRVSPARHVALLDGQAAGAAIVADARGRPRLHKPGGDSPAEHRARLIRATKREAARRIDSISPIWRQINDLRASGDAAAARRFAAIDGIRAASAMIERDIAATAGPALAALPIADHPAWPEAKDADIA